MQCPSCHVPTNGCLCSLCNAKRDSIYRQTGVFITESNVMGSSLNQIETELKEKQLYNNDINKIIIPKIP